MHIYDMSAVDIPIGRLNYALASRSLAANECPSS